MLLWVQHSYSFWKCLSLMLNDVKESTGKKLFNWLQSIIFDFFFKRKFFFRNFTKKLLKFLTFFSLKNFFKIFPMPWLDENHLTILLLSRQFLTKKFERKFMCFLINYVLVASFLNQTFSKVKLEFLCRYSILQWREENPQKYFEKKFYHKKQLWITKYAYSYIPDTKSVVLIQSYLHKKKFKDRPKLTQGGTQRIKFQKESLQIVYFLFNFMELFFTPKLLHLVL